MLLFTGGAGSRSRKRRLVADDAEVEPEDGPCSVRGFMGSDILSARDRGTGRRGLGRGARFGEEALLCWIWASEVTSWLLCSWALGPAGGRWRAARGRAQPCRGNRAGGRARRSGEDRRGAEAGQVVHHRPPAVGVGEGAMGAGGAAAGCRAGVRSGRLGWARKWALGREVRWLVWAVIIQEYRGKIPC